MLAKLNTWRLLSARSALKLEMFCRCFSFVRDFLVFDNLPLIEAAEASFLDSQIWFADFQRPRFLAARGSADRQKYSTDLSKPPPATRLGGHGLPRKANG